MARTITFITVSLNGREPFDHYDEHICFHSIKELENYKKDRTMETELMARPATLPNWVESLAYHRFTGLDNSVEIPQGLSILLPYHDVSDADAIQMLGVVANVIGTSVRVINKNQFGFRGVTKPYGHETSKFLYAR